MPQHDEREQLRELLMEDVPEFPAVVPVHLSSCQAIADCFLVNRSTVRLWRDSGAPIAMIGGRLAAEYNMLMLWHVRQSRKGTGEAR